MPHSSPWSTILIALLAATACQSELPVETDRVTISGYVMDEQSQGVAGVKVHGIAYTDISEATTDDDGRYVLSVIEERARQLAIIADDSHSDRLGIYKAPWDDPPDAECSIEIQLRECQRLPVQVTDASAAPAANVRVGALINYAPLVTVVTDTAGKAVLRLPADGQVQSLYAVLDGVGFDYRVVKTPRDGAYSAQWLNESPVRFQLADSQTVKIRLVDRHGNPIPRTEIYLWLLNKPGEPDSFNLSFTPTVFRAATDKAGVAEFRGVPIWDVHPLTFWPSTDKYVRQRIEFDPKQHSDGQLTVTLDRLVTVTGRVQFPDGQPAADISVLTVGAGYQDGFRKEVTSNEDGQFQMDVAPNLLYMFGVQDQRWAAPVIDGLIVRPDEPVEGLVLKLCESTRVHGRVTVGPDEKPVAGQGMGLQQMGRDLHHLEGAELPNPEDSRRWVQTRVVRQAVTDADGHFEFFVGPGKFWLSGPSQLEPTTFEIVDQKELEFNFASPRPEKGQLTGTVVTADPPRPVAGAIINGIYRSQFAGWDFRFRTDEQGHFSGERELHTAVLRAESQDGKLAGIVQIGPDDTEVTVRIGPLASARGRLIDFETGAALPETEVRWARRVHRGDDNAPWTNAWGGTVTTDHSGFFEFTGMVVGQEYRLTVPRGDGRSSAVSSVTPEAAEAIELGDLELKPLYKPPTFEERVDRELALGRPAGERFDHALKEADRLRQHLLVVFLQRDTPLTESWFKLRLDDRPVRAALPDYQLIQVDVLSEGARALEERLGIPINSDKLPIWQFCDSQGKVLETRTVPRLTDDGDTIDRAAVLETLARHSPEPLDARQLMEEALDQAATSNRRVIVLETATWCAPCHMLARYLEQHRSLWGKDYLWVRIDQRWHGSDEVMNKIKAGYRGGIPWYAILDSNGRVLATSNGPNGNIGFPSEPESIDHFISMIESTMQRMSRQELATLRGHLEAE